MDLSVITITWNSAKFITDQIRSVNFASQNLDFEQIIVDNASTDDTVSIVKSNFSKVKMIASQKNLGFGGGYNEAVKIAQGKYFLYLNPDMKILSPIGPLIKYLEQNPEVGIVGCKLTASDGKINILATPRRFPKLSEVLITFLKIPKIFPKVLDNYLYQDKNWNEIQAVDSVRGSFMLLRSDLVSKLGRAFDPRYFLWWEDVDLCREVNKLGFKVVYNPVVQCEDKVGQSFSRRKLLWKQWMFFKSAFKYFSKWKTN